MMTVYNVTSYLRDYPVNLMLLRNTDKLKTDCDLITSNGTTEC